MRSTLRNIILAPIVMAAAVLATNSAMAEVTVKVPFNFSVNGKQCPAGLYRVDKDTSRSIVRLQSKDSSRNFAWVLGPGSDGPKDAKVVLQFDQQGERHALAAVQYGSLTTSKIDRKAIENESISAPMGQGR